MSILSIGYNRSIISCLCFIFLLSLTVCVKETFPATYYLSPPAGGPGGTGTINDPWHDLNYVLNKYANDSVNARIRPSDTLYLRGGVYNIAAMTKPSNHSGPVMSLNTSSGSSRITIKSYPGEWAVLDGGGTTKILEADGRTYNITFEDMEIRNGYGSEGPGFAFGDGWSGVSIVNGIFRNLFFHDNTNPDYNTNPGGLLLSGDNCVVEYCTFENNGTPGSSHHNSANLILYNSYNGPNNGSVLGGIDVSPRKNNIIRYNRFVGSAASIKDKGEGNFVDMRPGHDPLTERHPEWYNDIHHNIIIGAADSGYYLHQDFVKVHDNVFINCTRGIYYDGYQQGTIPLIWEAQIYNNTFVGSTYADIQVDESQLSNSSYGGYNYSIYNNLSVSPQVAMFRLFSRGFVSPTPVWPMIADHNGMDSSTGKPVGYYASVIRNIVQWNALNLGTNTIYTTLSLNADYTLPSGSPARGAGRNGVDLGAFPSGVNSWYDFAGYNKSSSNSSVPDNLTIVTYSNP